MTEDEFWRIVEHLERENNGWLDATSGLRAQAFVDGVEVSHVARANRKQGIVERYVTDEDGRVILSDDRSGFVTRTIKGKVALVPIL